MLTTTRSAVATAVAHHRLWRSAASAALMLVAALLAAELTPQLAATDASVPVLEARIPQTIGPWQADGAHLGQVGVNVNPEGRTDVDRPYDVTLFRTYRDVQGRAVMLAVAYGQFQRQEVKIHRPDLCYPAQGLEVVDLQPASFVSRNARGTAVTGHHMLAVGPGRFEAVSYWIRIGDVYSDSAWRTRLHIVQEGLQGRIPDGVLVRASMIVRDRPAAAAAFVTLDTFLKELVDAVPAETRSLLVR